MGIVVALEGNALPCRGEKPDASTQIRNVEIAAHKLAKPAEEHELVLTHGNGPQVGVLAPQSANDERLSEPYPFDTLGAQTQGMIGYWLLQAIQNALTGRYVVIMADQTSVMAGDPAFFNPIKFVGEAYTKEEVEKLAEEWGWVVKPDSEHYRRVVDSPMSQRVIETHLVRTLLDAGVIVICSGGGGVPVVRSEKGKLKGIEAVIDKDPTASVMAEVLEADALLILTDADGVLRNFRTENQKQVPRATPAELRSMGPPSGSMGPKIETVCRFVELTGDMAAIGRFKNAVFTIEGHVGTIVTPGGDYGGPDDIHPPIPEQLDTRIRRA